MIRYECLQRLAAFITDQLVVTSLSGQKIEWAHLSDHDGNLLIGNMGNALGVGLGLALALPHRKVIVLESDGSVLLSLFNLPTLANLRPDNLLVFVFDNEVYSGSRISEPTATAGRTDLRKMAEGAGIENALTVTDIDPSSGPRPRGSPRTNCTSWCARSRRRCNIGTYPGRICRPWKTSSASSATSKERKDGPSCWVEVSGLYLTNASRTGG